MTVELFCKSVVKEHILVQDFKFAIIPKLPDVKHRIIVRVFIRLNNKYLNLKSKFNSIFADCHKKKYVKEEYEYNIDPRKIIPKWS
jgi:hypothetical protein